MTADALARSPLGHRAADLARVAAETEGASTVVEIPFLAQVDLRIEAGEAGRRGLALPHERSTVIRADDRATLWLGPNEWLMLGPPGTVAEIAADLWAALEGAHCSIVDVGASRAWLELAGAGSRELLSKGCSLDLHPRHWRLGTCAQTMLARAQVVLEQIDEDATRIGVRPSFGDYLVDWLLDAAGQPPPRRASPDVRSR